LKNGKDQAEEEEGEHSATKSEIYQELVEAARGAIQAERSTVIRLRDEGLISDNVMRKVERELDLEESRYQLNS